MISREWFFTVLCIALLSAAITYSLTSQSQARTGTGTTAGISPVTSSPTNHQSRNVIVSPPKQPFDLSNDLPIGDTTSERCRQLVQEANAQARAATTPDGHYFEMVWASKYIYAKKLCLASIEDQTQMPGVNKDTWKIVDLATQENIAEMTNTGDVITPFTWMYFGQQTKDVSKTPTELWMDIRDMR